MLFLILGVMICSASFLGARAGAHRWLRIEGTGIFSLDAEERYFVLPRARRWTWRLAGPTAAYAVCVALAFLSLRQETAETNTVDVLPGGPAAQAGMQNGDRILEINGAESANWGQTRAMIAAGGAVGPVSVKVQRGAELRRFDIVPENGKIRIAPRIQPASLPIGQTLVTAVAKPVTTIAQTVSSAWTSVAGKHEEQLRGPVGIVSYSSSSRGPGRVLLLLFVALSAGAQYTWPLAIILEIALSPRRRRTPASGGEAQ